MKNGIFSFSAIFWVLILAMATKAYSVETIFATFDNPKATAPMFIPGNVVPIGTNKSDRPWKICGLQDAFKIENRFTIPGNTLASGNFLRVVDSYTDNSNYTCFDFFDRRYDNVCIKISWDVLFETNDNYFFDFRNGRFDDPHNPAKNILANIYTSGSTIFFHSKDGIIYHVPYQTRTPIHFDVYMDLTNNKWAAVMDNEVLFNDANIIDSPFGLFVSGSLKDEDLHGAMEIDNIHIAPLEPCDWPEKPKSCSLKLPDPQLEFIGIETYGNRTRYKLIVTNWTKYPNELFAPSPDLSPCGSKPDASRTWVYLEDQNGHIFSVFCALSKSEHLATTLEFEKKANEAPPSSVRIILKDRLCNREYRSNLATIDPDAVCRNLPVPQLQFMGVEPDSTAYGNFTKYKLSVTNWNDFWPELFVASPNLAPCGLNNQASRSWVDIYDASNNKIYGFCTLSEPHDLTKLWFEVSEGQMPEQVKIVITDRLCDKKVESPLIRLPADQLASVKITIDGSGRVISDSGILCTNNELGSSTLCTFHAKARETVTLKAIPLSNNNHISSFVRWGESCNGYGNCTFTAIGENAVAAQFATVRRPGYSLPVPTSANVFTYRSVAEPQFNPIIPRPRLYKPFAVGNLRSGMINLKMALPPFSGPVDIYLGIKATPISPSEIFLFVPIEPFGYNIVPYSTSGLIAWRQATTEAIFQSFFGEIPKRSLPAGPYTLYTLVTPAGSLESYYLWVSTFTIP